MAGICKAKGRHKVWRDGRYCMEKWKCGRKTSSRGYCHTHYSAILKGAKSLHPAGEGRRDSRLDKVFAEFEAKNK